MSKNLFVLRSLMVTRACILIEVAFTTGFKVLSQGERWREGGGNERTREKEREQEKTLM